MKELIQQIEQWAEERNLIQGSTPQKQMLKLMEEFGELCGGIAKNKPDVIKDSIGDCAVVLIVMAKQLNFKLVFDNNNSKSPRSKKDNLPYFVIKVAWLMLDVSERGRTVDEYDFVLAQRYLMQICQQLGFDFNKCLARAWNDIKDRKGKMINGVFVKEEDL